MCPRHYRVEDFAQAIRAIGEPIHARPADQISMARLLTLLFEVTALFDMTTRLELVLLQKTMVVVEGVARKLDPQLNMWATAEPVVGGWIAENLGPRGRIEDVARGAARRRRRRLPSCRRVSSSSAERWRRSSASGATGRPAGVERRCWVIAVLVWIAMRLA